MDTSVMIMDITVIAMTRHGVNLIPELELLILKKIGI